MNFDCTREVVTEIPMHVDVNNDKISLDLLRTSYIKVAEIEKLQINHFYTSVQLSVYVKINFRVEVLRCV